jgi:hypothetical protein
MLTAQAKELAAAKAKEELEKLRLDLLPAMITGKSFVEGEAAGTIAHTYEGLTPKEINALASKFMESRGPSSWSAGGMPVVSDDPFEGMSPEEIDEYARLHGLT